MEETREHQLERELLAERRASARLRRMLAEHMEVRWELWESGMRARDVLHMISKMNKDWGSLRYPDYSETSMPTSAAYNDVLTVLNEWFEEEE